MDELRISAEDFERLIAEVTPWLAECVRRSDTGPTSFMDSLDGEVQERDRGRTLASKLREEHAPETGQRLDSLMDTLCNVAARTGRNGGSAAFCAYVPTGGLLQTAVADLIAAALNRSTPLFISNPGLVQLEFNALSWMAQLVGYDPDVAFGSFSSGGSMANFIGVLVARRKHLPEENIATGAVMATSQTHSCIGKGLIMAGLPRSSLCLVECDEKLRMCPAALEKCIVAQRNGGRVPFLVVASAGTTSTGAVDDLRALASVCKRHGVWLHVDGVYGAAFNLTQRGREQLDGLEEADSIAIDLHKSFFLPQATGLLMVKERVYLKQAFALDHQPAFLPDVDQDDRNFLDHSPDLTRPCYGLRLWFPLQLCGLGRWRAALDDRLDWTGEFADGLRAMARIGIELTTEPSLTILTFRYAPTHEDDSSSVMAGNVSAGQVSSGVCRSQRLRDANQKLLRFINGRDHIFLSSTILPGGEVFVLRACILHVRLTRQRLLDGLQDIRDGVAEIRASASAAELTESTQVIE
ncbi:aromatic-L-amino-acid decarboxylase-like [Sycon ciliatum]|uniref:aromatic-L-amino-acid decarboxylase-like n=1 Tax=Sycon ciliatum TaxID=27933 RepID=UPI0031F700DD